ncbi:MAG: hypothetical protein EHM71_13390 [Zetaproteobacteria bacterium]|nr:MAG: hypothetical protein EHM71_13390 [Zetaproteobacteria bacterium]
MRDGHGRPIRGGENRGGRCVSSSKQIAALGDPRVAQGRFRHRVQRGSARPWRKDAKNRKRCLRLSRSYASEGVRSLFSRSQIVILKRGSNIKYLPYAFTEHGAIMAATVLNSPRAVQMSVFVVRAFVRMRRALAGTHALARKLAELEQRLAGHDESIRALLEAVRQLMLPPARKRRSIGFKMKAPRPVYRRPRRGKAR